MSVEVTVWCDECKRVIATGPTPASARLVVLGERGMVNMPGGEDVCAKCAKAIRDKPWLRKQAERRWGRTISPAA